MCTIIALKSHCLIEILKQFNKIDIYLALCTALVEQELKKIKKIKESAACVHTLLYLKMCSFWHLNKKLSKQNF